MRSAYLNERPHRRAAKPSQFLALLHSILTISSLVLAPAEAPARQVGTAVTATDSRTPLADMPPALPNLASARTSEWPEPLLVTKGSGDTSEPMLFIVTNKFWISWAMVNNGAVATSTRFRTDLLLDGVVKKSWFTDPPLSAGGSAYVRDYFLGSLSVGKHTIVIRHDATFSTAESDETDNTYSRELVIRPAVPEITVRPQSLRVSMDSSTASQGAIVASTTTVPRVESQQSLALATQDASPTIVSNTPPRPILLRQRPVMPTGMASNVSSTLPTDSDIGKTRHVLLQFGRTVSSKERTKLMSEGLRLLRYVPENTYWAVRESGVSDEEWADLKERWGIRLINNGNVAKLGLVEVALGANERTVRTSGESTAIAASSVEATDYHVVFFEDVTRDVVTSLMAWLGITVVQWDGKHTIRAPLTASAVKALSANDFVEWVEPAPVAHKIFNIAAASRAHAAELLSAPYGLRGGGIIVGVWDEGLADAHPDYADRLHVGDTSALSSHATHVVGTIAGSGYGAAEARGLAPATRVESYDWHSDAIEMRDASQRQIRFSNHSYGFPTGWEWNGSVWVDLGRANFGKYGVTCSEWDDIVKETGLNIFKAAGNDRNDGPDYPFGPAVDGPYDCIDQAASAKNILTIGATTLNDTVTRFSSWGPTDDGRIKPDLCAPGESLYSTQPGNTYGALSGTSMSAAAACGAGVLLGELHSRVTGAQIAPATCKALLIHAATDLGTPGPDYQNGWGLINAAQSARLLANQYYTESALENENQERRYALHVAAGTALLKATVVWTDPPAFPGAQKTLVNDLDLLLIDPSGAPRLPWVLNPANPSEAAREGTNHIDNVEQVQVRYPTNGEWTLVVRSSSIAMGPQSYSLVCEALPESLDEDQFIIENDGGVDLRIQSITTTASSVSCIPSSPFVVPPSERRVITVVVAITNAPFGNTTAEVHITSNDTDEPVSIVAVQISRPRIPQPFLLTFSQGVMRNDFSGYVGMEFLVGASPLVISSLGRFTVPGSCSPHHLKLVDAETGADVLDGSVLLDFTTTPHTNPPAFVFTPLPKPVNLAPGKRYLLVSHEQFGRDKWQDIGTVVRTSPDALVLGGAYAFGSFASAKFTGPPVSPWYYFGGQGHSYVPLTFQYTIEDAASACETPFARGFVTGPQRSDFTGFVGFRFLTSDKATVVTQLGRYALPGSRATHTLKLVEASTGKDVPGATATLTLSGQVVSFPGVNYAPLPIPVSLRPSTEYLLVCSEVAGGDTWHDIDTRIIPLNTNITSLGGVYGPLDSQTPGAWHRYGAAGQSYGPLDMYLRAQCEPCNLQVTAGVTSGLSGSSSGDFANSVPLSVASGLDFSTVTNRSAPVQMTLEPGVVLKLSVPARWNNHLFSKWLKDGLPFSTAPTITNQVDFTSHLAAIYSPYDEQDLIVTTTPGRLRNDYSGWVGPDIAIGPRPVLITRLGRVVSQGNKFAHAMKIVDASTGLDVPGSDCAVSTAGNNTNTFSFAPLRTPVTLLPYRTYLLLSYEIAGLDTWYDANTRVVTTSAASVLTGAYGIGNPAAWYFYGADSCAYGPLNAKYVLPEDVFHPFVQSHMPGTMRNDFSGYIGMRIDISTNPVIVAQLGRLVVSTNSRAHVLKLVDARTGADLQGGSTIVDTRSATPGAFAYGTLETPLLLSPLSSYYLVSREEGGGDHWLNVDTVCVTSPIGKVATGVYGSTPGVWYIYGAQNHGYGPLNIRYLPHPAGGSVSHSAAMAAFKVSSSVANLAGLPQDSTLTLQLTLGSLPGQITRALSIRTTPGVKALESSEDLRHWQFVQLLRVEATGTVLQLHAPTTASDRFYRLVPMD